ncbi:putative p-type atpase [Operophtera brumata]|uniref:Putative P-type atpase n=1 Tax=Operophtera brumata TaxID=104452 RepID=A0A0L7L3R4_OPEBR|nr:putative p-type atpase [Operophtera brumata]
MYVLSAAPLKRSTIDRQTNTQILMLFIILLVLSLISATFNEFWVRTHSDWYIGLNEAQNSNFGFNCLTFLILYNNLIPISLQVTAEIVRFFQSNTPALARTSNLNEELGMVKYIFSDKTGTLTCNVMKFCKCSIAEVCRYLHRVHLQRQDGHPHLQRHEVLQVLYSGGIDKTGTLTCNVMKFCKCSIAEIIYNSPMPNERLEDTLLQQNLQRNHPSAPVIREFLTMMAIYELALVSGAAAFGFVFCTRTPSVVEIKAGGRTEEYTILNVIDFTSTRKRIVLYPRLAREGGGAPRYADGTLAHLESFAVEGLRTLVFAVATIPTQVYKVTQLHGRTLDQLSGCKLLLTVLDWSNTFYKASIAIQNREQKIEEAALLIENNLQLLGATAIEDKLQETAINIAHSARLIHPHMPLILINEDSLDGTRDSIARHAAEFGDSLRQQEEVALVIDGNTLKYAMGCDLKKEFLDLCLASKVVLCCRVSPIQKAEVVDMVATATKAVTLAIGDGANDVAMIQRASVGVGISGVEGLQAVCASDYSIAQFRFLLRLLLVHGAWNYARISKLILYSFYKNICLYVIELWFAIYSAWSGQILFERWTIGFYNLIFTSMPPLAMGLFDKLCSPEIMLQRPELYITSQQSLLFNVRVFWVWAMNSLLHSVMLFWLPVGLAQNPVLWPSGKDGGVHNSAFKTVSEAVRESEIKQRDPAELLAQPRHS